MNRGRILLAAAAMLALAGTAWADYDPTNICWKGWRVESSENLFEGAKYTQYPLTHLFDGKADTAWVFSAKPHPKPLRYPNVGKVLITLLPAKPFKLDGLAIHNGYCKSEKLFRYNDRPAEVTVTLEGPPPAGGAKSAEARQAWKLQDRPTRQTLAFAQQTVSSISIEVTAITAGQVHDLCISELELLLDGKKIDMAMPAAVRFTTGSECGCGTEYSMVTLDGKAIVHGSGGDMGDLEQWDSRGRLLADVHYSSKGNTYEVWIADAAKGRVLFRHKLPAEPVELKFKTDHLLHVKFEGKRPGMDVVIPEASSGKGCWINVHAGAPGLAGVVVQQMPDNSEQAHRGRHPAMILFVFEDTRVHQFEYDPDGKVTGDFWWKAEKTHFVWLNLDRSFATAAK